MLVVKFIGRFSKNTKEFVGKKERNILLLSKYEKYSTVLFHLIQILNQNKCQWSKQSIF